MQTIVMTNLGPIARAEIELRPLTILTGANGAGKTHALMAVHSAVNALADAREHARKPGPPPPAFIEWAKSLTKENHPRSVSEARYHGLAGDTIHDCIQGVILNTRAESKRWLKRTFQEDLSGLSRGSGINRREFTLQNRPRRGYSNGQAAIGGIIDDYLDCRDGAPLPALQEFFNRVRRTGFEDPFDPEPVRSLRPQAGRMAVYLYNQAMRPQFTVNPPGTAHSTHSITAIRWDQESELMDQALEYLEREVLQGTVELNDRGENEWPAAHWQPLGRNDQRHELGRAPRAAAHLAPVILCLREQARPGNLILLENPETGLDLEKQRSMGRCIVRLVNGGLNLLVETHSDMLINEISDRIKSAGIPRENRTYPETEALEPGRVAAYRFRMGPDGSEAERLPVNPDEGIDDEWFSQVIERAYRDGIEIQRQIQEAGAGTKNEEETDGISTHIPGPYGGGHGDAGGEPAAAGGPGPDQRGPD